MDVSGVRVTTARLCTAHAKSYSDPKFRPIDDGTVTDWLLQHPHIDATEFDVLFAIHKLNSRPHRSAWIRRIHLCSSSGSSQVQLTWVLTDLRHPVDSSRARYVLLVH